MKLFFLQSNMPSSLIRTIVGSLICFTSIALAEPTCPDGEKHYRASVRHIEAGGIGYNQGYSTLEVFLAPDPGKWCVMPFLDARGHVFNNGKWAANAGGGIRGILGCRTYGISAFYDYRNTKKIHYNQIGLGLETLGKLWDFRINGYLPVGKKISSPYDTQFNRFSGHRMILTRKFQFAMKGADAEAGFHFGKSRLLDFYAAAGPYYYIGNGRNTWGGKARIRGTFKDYLTLEISDSYDGLFRNNFQGQLTFSWPFGNRSRVEKKGCCSSCELAGVLASRMVQPVAREEIIVVSKRKKHVKATDAVTRQPLYFVFVDNLSHSDGTFQSPYPTLALAEAHSGPGDIIYVFPGDGTTTGMDAGITLQAQQKFWGSANSHFIQTAQGGITVPPFSSSVPQMTNTTGDGITLATNNEISGFTLTAAADNGIFGLNPENVNISSCTISSSQLDHIHLVYNSSPGTAALSGLSLINGFQSGVFIESHVPSLMTCRLSDSLIEASALYSINASFSDDASFSLLNNSFINNDNSANFAFSGPTTLLVSGNIFTGNSSINLPPLLIAADAKPLTATIENNTISDNVCSGVHFVLNNTNAAQLTLTNNTILNNGIGSIGPFGAPVFIDPNSTLSGNCHLTLTNNTLSGNAGDALLFFNGGFNDLHATITGNEMISNGGGLIFASPCSSLTLVATDNTISKGNDHGISTVGININTANITLTNNHINDNANFANGVVLNHSGTDLNFIAKNNEISGNASSGIVFFSSGVIENAHATIENNVINNNQNASNFAGGIDLEQFTHLSATIANNTLTDNAILGVYVNSNSALPASSTCLEMSGNNSNTGYLLSDNAGTFNLAPCDVDTVNTGTIIKIGITSVQSCPGAAACP